MSETSFKDEIESTAAGFVTHLLELRDRLLRIVIFLAVLFAVLFAFANDIYNFLATPLLAHMPQGSSMIAIEVISPFLTPLKMAMYAALMLGMPYILYQMWSFVAPGLYKHEKRLATPLLISSIFLFYSGVAFAYFVVFPLVFAFLVSVAPEGVAVMTDINKYLDFVLALFFAFGLAFEVPVATIILIAMGVTTADSLLEKRPYIIVGAFVIGMLLTPPDVISQIMLALPMWLLFEVGIIMSRILIQPKDDDEYAEEDDEDSPSPTGSPAMATAGASAAASSAASAANQSATTTEANTVAETETSPEETAPTGYSAAAYPEDYEPLSEDELEAELDKASEWDEDDEDYEVTDEEYRQIEKSDSDDTHQAEPADDTETVEDKPAEDDDQKPENNEAEATDDEPASDEKPNSRDTEEFLDDLKKRYPDEDGSVA